MVSGLPFGHIAKKATLPVGVMAEFSLHAGRAALSWKEMP
jgi:muramoyltetrapeptide carboxypeptidase